ncbi:poliovirus receptor homolog [Gadus macrocephalus]|uniref:poliovirus receptor homolog n=1 Tax=Gadus macrocephalus TaxID=80720 RepID=UPI0028CB3F18|nr:poliovirus receptor homolog [Gadus macrocephalus]
MSRHYAGDCHGSSRNTGLVILATFLFIHGGLGQRVKVETEVLSYPGQTVNLRCSFNDPSGIQLTQVTWIYEPVEGERVNIAVYHPNFGAHFPETPQKGRVTFVTNPPSLPNPSIQISDVKMSDEGKYICEFATYPSGNELGTTSLIMLAKPKNTAEAVTAVAGTKPAVVARCQSANGRPEALISWVTTANGNASTVPKTGADNMVTVVSEYLLVPTAADNGKDISCVVTHRTLTKPESFPMKLAVEYPPKVTIIGYDNNWYVGRTNVELTCQANGNPHPTTVKWRILTGEMPDTVVLKEHKLTVLKVDEAVNTTFICEVKNRLGTGKEQVTALVREPPTNPSNAGVVAGVVIGSLLVLLLVAALIAVLVTRSRKQQQGYRGNGASDIKSRIFGGKKASKNGTGGGGVVSGGVGGGGGNNNGPVYMYNESAAHQGEKNNHHQPLNVGGAATAPSAQDILLSSELDEAERMKFDELEEEDERYDHFAGGAPILQLRPPQEPEDMIGGYLDDDMESQRDGSVISRTAVYV